MRALSLPFFWLKAVPALPTYTHTNMPLRTLCKYVFQTQQGKNSPLNALTSSVGGDKQKYGLYEHKRHHITVKYQLYKHHKGNTEL